MSDTQILVSVEDYEKKARTKIHRHALDYYRSGAGNELSLRLNKSCFDRFVLLLSRYSAYDFVHCFFFLQYFFRIRIRPRFLRDVSSRDPSIKMFGDSINIPLGISPTAMQKMAHPDGELANARAAEAAGIIFTLSTIATSSIEEVAKAAPRCIKWFQLYIYKDREITKKLVRRAENAGFKAIVLTIDAPIFGLRRADIRNQFGLPPELKFANLEVDDQTKNADTGDLNISGINKYVTGQFDQTLVWSDLKWLVNFTKLPVLVKGILTEEDAILSVKYGCRGVIVSNHGARQLDGVPASIEALPEIVRAVGDETVVVLDGGITQGTDVFKALALGAKMVFAGRPAIWGLAVNGQKGVESVIDIIRNEFDIAMALTGCKTVNDISKDMVVHENYYSKL